MTDSDDFLNAGIDSLGGADADSDPSIGATPSKSTNLNWRPGTSPPRLPSRI